MVVRLVAALAVFGSALGAAEGPDLATFQNPPAEFRGRAMWGYDLSKVTEAQIVREIRGMAKDRFGGFFIAVNGGNGKNLDPAYVRQGAPHLKFYDSGIEYLSDEFFRLYRVAMAEAKRNGMSVVFYDDYEYPTGTVGGQLFTKYPQYMAKRLDMVEKDVAGPARVELAVPEGIYVGAVLMNTRTHERIDVSARKTANGRVACEAGAGPWKLMVFYLNTTAILKIRNPGLVDYLDEDAMKAFIAMSYDKFYDHLKDYWGSLITMSFYDEPTLHWMNGRMWTASLNTKFEKKYGRSAMKDYPALWYDIGPETAAARNALFGMRAQIFADNFSARLARWCTEHGIESSGHLDQEEVVNPVPTNGDLMKMFEHQSVPGHDDIFYLGRSNRGYKVVTSAAFNYDKPVTMAETYAAYTNMDDTIAAQVAMDQYAMGINRQVSAKDISQRLKDVGKLNDYVGRLSYMLQHGRHVADVAVVYPIASLEAAYTFRGGRIPAVNKPETDQTVDELARTAGPDWEYAYNGGLPPDEIDYMDVGEMLFRSLRVDYTYLHPEVLTGRCVVRGNRLVLENKENREEFRVLILPGGDTLSLAVAEKIAEFYEHGGTVIATSRLPVYSAEAGRDAELRARISVLFGAPGAMRKNASGGRLYLLAKPSVEALKAVLREVLPVRDVDFAEAAWPVETGRKYDGALTYIHKVKDGRDVYFFANSSKKVVDTIVTLRGNKALTLWNPHDGTRGTADLKHEGELTKVRLVLPPVSSSFYIGVR
ncbi:MAG: glycosyl hydrolase [Bryobacteraceae bacterium]